jgi:trk system potassium uptake protein TrkH
MVFLPELRVGGMQIFSSEAFDTMGKVLPRAVEIAAQISWIYVGLTIANVLAYLAVGMTPFDAINHAFTTMSTGGFSTRDASFGAFQGAPEYVASVFMIFASLPFVRYIQIVGGTARPLFTDPQVRGYLGLLLFVTLMLAFYRLIVNADGLEHGIREGLFNAVSIISGTGYASTDYQLWGNFPMVAFFFFGLVGGCAGSTACSVKIFRYQLLFASVRAQIRTIHSPSGVFTPRYAGRSVGEDVLSSVMAFFVMFVISLGMFSMALSLTGLDMITSISGAATALANVGPGLGPTIGPAGNFAALNDTAKWLLVAAMLVGRLEVLSVFVLFTRRFWSD